MANIIIDSWERSDKDEREEFLRDLHRRYGFGRICKEIIGKEGCWFYQKMAALVEKAKHER